MRTLLTVVLGASLITTLTWAPRACAQTLEPPRHRQGYYIALGGHGGVSHTWEDGKALGVWGGWAQSVRLGQLLTRRLGLGLSFDFAGSSGDQQTATLVGVSLEAHVELIRNLALRAGAGLGVVSLEDQRDPDEPLRGVYAAGYSLGVSYEWFPSKKRLTGGFAVTPVVQVHLVPGDSVTSIMALGGVEIGYWSGLPQNQLELPDSEAYKKRVQ